MFLREKNDNQLNTKYAEPIVTGKVLSFIGRNVLHRIWLQYVYGQLFPALKRIDKIRYTHPMSYYSIDACESDIPHKLGLQGDNKRKNLLSISTFRVADHFNIPVGEVKFLERCGESYKKTYDETVGAIIAQNILHSKTKGQILHLMISSDLGTQSNNDHVRNALINGVKDELGMGPDEFLYENKNTGITYDLRELTVEVCFNCSM